MSFGPDKKFQPPAAPPAGIDPRHSSFMQNQTPFQPVEQHSAAAQSNVHKRGVPGAGWADDDDVEDLRRPGQPVLPHQQAAPPVTHMPTTAPPSHPPIRSTYEVPQAANPHYTSEEPGKYEARLVENITMPGGARAKPLDKELNEFCAACKFLNHEIIASLLYKQFSVRGRCIKALYVLEKLARTYESYQDYIRQNRQALNMTSGDSPQSQKVVQTILNLVDGVHGSQSDAGLINAMEEPKMANNAVFDLAPKKTVKPQVVQQAPPEEAPAAPQQAPPQPVDPMSQIFQGLEQPVNAYQEPTTVQPTAAANTQVPVQPQAPSAPSADFPMLDLLAPGSNSAPPMQPTASPQQPQMSLNQPSQPTSVPIPPTNPQRPQQAPIQLSNPQPPQQAPIQVSNPQQAPIQLTNPQPPTQMQYSQGMVQVMQGPPGAQPMMQPPPGTQVVYMQPAGPGYVQYGQPQYVIQQPNPATTPMYVLAHQSGQQLPRSNLAQPVPEQESEKPADPFAGLTAFSMNK